MLMSLQNPSVSPDARDRRNDVLALLQNERGLHPDSVTTSRVLAKGSLALALLSPTSLYFAFNRPGDVDQLEIRELRWANAVSIHPPACSVAFGSTWFQFVDISAPELERFCPLVKRYPERSFPHA